MARRRFFVYVFTLWGALVFLATPAVAANTYANPDTDGNVGRYTSAALDAAGNPVVSYYDDTNGDLKLLHCNDPACLGDDESISSPDTAGNVGHYTSLVLDASGNPVISYLDVTNADLKILHCNDANCAGGGESITSPDTSGIVGAYSSLELDAEGYPVVSYYDITNENLKVLHCNDPNCFGGGESITSPDTAGAVGYYTSLVLDGAGYPVVSYYDVTNRDLKILHCNDANCAGGGESIMSPDTPGDVGTYSSLELDAEGYPVVSYLDVGNSDLTVLHCNDVNCAGGDESITSPDTAGVVGYDTSLVLDGRGNPIVSYTDYLTGDLKLLHCNDANCAGEDSIIAVDVKGFTGYESSLALDGEGNPVISYYDNSEGDLKVLHCDNPLCATVDGSISSPDTAGSVGWDASLVLDGGGNPVVSYYDDTNGDLKLLHCNDANCVGGGESAVSVDMADVVGKYTSLALDEAGNVIVSYQNQSSGDLRVLHCNDPYCIGGGETFTSPDTTGNTGYYTSLALDAMGYPVISYYDLSNGDLKVMHCNDASCASGSQSIQSPDMGGDVGWYTSLALDAAGYPVVSYYDSTNGDLKVLHCNDANCAGGDESITSPDTADDVGFYTSLALDGAGNPVVSYYDVSNGDLKVLHCNDANCAGGDESIMSPDTEGDVGWDSDIVLDGNGYPVVSYGDGSNGDLKVLHCNDANCAGGDESITSPDSLENVGWLPSLALDGDGNPVVAYLDVDNSDLKLLHCYNANCSLNMAPEVDAGTNRTVSEGDVVSFAGSAIDAAGEALTLLWDFGDGATAAGTLTPDHLYADDGNYVVTLTATDERGLAASDTLLVTVENAPPVVDAGSDVTVGVGQMVTFAGAFSDAGTQDTHAIAWDFDDGEAAKNSLSPSHAFAAAGTYEVTLTVTDDDGGVGTDMIVVMVTAEEVNWRLFLPVFRR